MKLALREDMTPGASLADKLVWLESVGIDGIELHSSSLQHSDDELLAIFSKSRVKASNVAGDMKLLVNDPAERARSREITKGRFQTAAKLGAAGVLEVPQFGRQAAISDLSPLKTAVELEQELFTIQLRELAPVAQAAGVPLFLEALNRYEAHLVNRLEQGSAFADAVGVGVAIMADFFHMHIEEVDIADAIRKNARHIVYVHVADSNRQQPGNGHLNFTPGFQALKEIGYDGWLGIECRIVGQLDEALKVTADHVRNLWASA